MRSINIPVSQWVLLLVATMVFGLGLQFQNLGLRSFALMGIAVALYGVILVPMRWSIFFVFIYLGFEGFLKIISSYHPVIHVGADIMVITLCLKVLVDVFFNGLKVEFFPPFTKLFIIHFSWLVIVLFNPYSLGLIPSIAGAKVYVSMFLLYFFGFYLTRSTRDIRFFMLPVIFVTVIHTITGIYQGLCWPSECSSNSPWLRQGS